MTALSCFNLLLLLIKVSFTGTARPVLITPALCRADYSPRLLSLFDINLVKRRKRTPNRLRYITDIGCGQCMERRFQGINNGYFFGNDLLEFFVQSLTLFIV